MLKLPPDLLAECNRYWPVDEALQSTNSQKIYDPNDITVVTAFFDLGRGEWKVDGEKKSPFQRSTDRYLEYFSHLAKLKNPLVIFVAPELAPRVLELREQAGLAGLTTIFTIADLFGMAKIAELAVEVQSKMTPAFRASTRAPLSPEYNYSKYVVLDALKSIFVTTAIAAKAIRTQQVAWLDFGYCRDGKCFDASLPWRFDTGGLMNLFHMRPIDDLPIFKVVQRGYVYFQGGCKIGPVSLWPGFATAIDTALAGLLGADLVDDEQTLVFMAWRANPKLFRIYAMDRRDWRVAIRFFNETRLGEDVAFTDYKFIKAVKDARAYAPCKNALLRTMRFLDKFV
jgi:protein YibB